MRKSYKAARKAALGRTKGRFTALDFEAFNGDPVMSVVIIMCKHKKSEIESGMDIFAELI